MSNFLRMVGNGVSLDAAAASVASETAAFAFSSDFGNSASVSDTTTSGPLRGSMPPPS
eukprot:CAMPEP_0180708376 /NCGR_PEP_ID=MMETSP1038_2-20121128/9210_1 /TAXON_ID=632150 /ORGANISM="Azadinium spinosum, Strain 3D9" /LENGTH=57 /DNA_ID=CAMNT_0022740379 /DNA_START=178 /DNA_END=351 /DNA_ORIENTATION=-